MFMKLTSVIAAALIVPAVLVQGMAVPTAAIIEARKTDASPDATVCTGAASADHGCVNIPISSDSCINFTSGLTFLNKEVSSAVIPDGFVCTFFEQFGCESALRGGDTTVLTGGTWTFTSVPGLTTNINFNDLASSFQCSPL